MRKASLDTEKNSNDRISDVILPVYGSSVDHGDANGNVQTGVCSGGSSGRVKGRGDQET